MRIVTQHILIDADPDIDKGSIKMKGADGKDVDFFYAIGDKDVKWSREYNSISGTITALPERKPEWFEAQIGDKAYFHFNAIGNAQEANMIVDGKFLIPIRSIFCSTREVPIDENGKYTKIFMWGDWCLVDSIQKPVEKTWGSGILIKPESAIKKEHSTFEGVLAHIGNVKDAEVKVGDRIVYISDGDIPLKVNGHTYFRMQYDWLQAIIPQPVTSGFAHMREGYTN